MKTHEKYQHIVRAMYITALLLFIYFLHAADKGDRALTGSEFSIVLIIVVTALCLDRWVTTLASQFCGSCGSYCVRIADKQALEVFESWRSTQTTDIHRDDEWQVTGRTNRKIVVPVEVTRYLITWTCDKCNLEWQTETNEERAL